MASGAHLPLEACLAKIGGSETEPPVDVLVVIVAHRYGWVPPDQPGTDQKSVTWLECEKAKANGKEVLAFLVDEKHNWSPDLREETRVSQAIREGKATPELLAEVQENVARLGRFKAWLDSKGIRATFTSPESLHAGVVAALYDWRNRHTDFWRSDATQSPGVPPVKAAALSNRDETPAQKRADLLAKWSLRHLRSAGTSSMLSWRPSHECRTPKRIGKRCHFTRAEIRRLALATLMVRLPTILLLPRYLGPRRR